MEIARTFKSLLPVIGIVIGSIVIGALVAVLRTEWQILVVVVAGIVLSAVAFTWIRRPKTWLYALLLYYPIHPTAYKLLTGLFPSIPSPIFSVWQDILILALLGAGLWQLRKQLSFRITALDLVIAAWLFWAVPSAINSGDFTLIVYGFRLTYLPVLLYFAMRLLPFRDLIEYRQLIDFILVVSGIVAISGILLYFVVPREVLQAWYAQNNFVQSYYQNILRMDSIFWTPVIFGSLMALAATLCFALLFSGEGGSSKRSRYFWGLLLFSFCCLMSLSRGAWISEVVGVGIIAFLNRKSRLGFLTIIGLIIGIGTLAAMIGSGSDDPFVKHVATIFDESELGTGQIPRSEQRLAGLRDISGNLLLGVGLGKTGYVAAWFEGSDPASAAIVADNWYIKLLQESGIIGFSIFILYLFVFVVRTYRGSRDLSPGPYRSLVLGVWAAFIGFCIQGYGSNVWDFYMLSSVYWILVGIIANITQVSHYGMLSARSRGATKAEISS